jgi:hypothetical protein
VTGSSFSAGGSWPLLRRGFARFFEETCLPRLSTTRQMISENPHVGRAGNCSALMRALHEKFSLSQAKGGKLTGDSGFYLDGRGYSYRAQVKGQAGRLLHECPQVRILRPQVFTPNIRHKLRHLAVDSLL